MRRLSANKRKHVRRVGLESTTAERQVGAVLRQLPGAQTSLHNLVGRRGRIDQVGDPAMPGPCQLNVLSAQTGVFWPGERRKTYQPGSI